MSDPALPAAPNITVTGARWSGVAAVAVLWSGIGLSVLRTGFAVSGDLPLSRLAEDGRASAIFGPSLVIGALLFTVFCLDVRRRHRAGPAFAVVMVTAMAGQFVAGVVPIGAAGKSDPVHVVAGLVLAASSPVPPAVRRVSDGPRRRRRAVRRASLRHGGASPAQRVSRPRRDPPALFFTFGSCRTGQR